MSFTGFWTALADANGNRLAGSEIQIAPNPIAVEYPDATLGTTLETVDGVAIQQAPSRDPRTRSWVWESWRNDAVQYQQLFARLASFRSRLRYQNGLSPYVYLLDTYTGKFEREVWEAHTVSSYANGVLTLTSSAATPGAFTNAGWLELTSGTGAGQSAYIAANTAATVTVMGGFSTPPTNGTTCTIRYRQPDWFRVRVLDVPRAVADGRATVTYAKTKLTFVVDDPSWNLL